MRMWCIENAREGRVYVSGGFNGFDFGQVEAH